MFPRYRKVSIMDKLLHGICHLSHPVSKELNIVINIFYSLKYVFFNRTMSFHDVGKNQTMICESIYMINAFLPNPLETGVCTYTHYVLLVTVEDFLEILKRITLPNFLKILKKCFLGTIYIYM